jgi:signal transduction histidine kinase
MSTNSQLASSSLRLPQVLGRTLRHEVGDLLQTLYSAVAILQERLPAEQTLERRLLTDLKNRAEMCKHELDAAVDLVCPVTLASAPLDLSELVAGLAATFATRFPNVQVDCRCDNPLFVVADARRLSQVGTMLLHAACKAARHRVWVSTALLPPGREVEWQMGDDGPGAGAEQFEWMTNPFVTTQHAQVGLGLALARRLLDLHGGRAVAENLPEGGFRVVLILPAAPAAS